MAGQAGGKLATGGTGGSGGDADGGAMAVVGGSLADSTGLVLQSNLATAGTGGVGGNGANGGTGGLGGNAAGGGLYCSGATVTLNGSPLIEYNLARGGWGGNGGSAVASGGGGLGGPAATAAAAAFTWRPAPRRTSSISPWKMPRCKSTRPRPASAGTAAKAQTRPTTVPAAMMAVLGGGAYLDQNGTSTVKLDQFIYNEALGCFGSIFGIYAGQASYGGHAELGGAAAGGGLYVGGGTVTLTNVAINNNVAWAGWAGSVSMAARPASPAWAAPPRAAVSPSPAAP